MRPNNYDLCKQSPFRICEPTPPVTFDHNFCICDTIIFTLCLQFKWYVNVDFIKKLISSRCATMKVMVSFNGCMVHAKSCKMKQRKTPTDSSNNVVAHIAVTRSVSFFGLRPNLLTSFTQASFGWASSSLMGVLMLCIYVKTSAALLAMLPLLA